MKIAVLIPSRGDRPGFLDNCKRLLSLQTLQPDHIEVVDFAPLDEQCDITPRYRFGYNKLSEMGFDVILFMEDDDYYSPNYIETMITEWNNADRPDIFGTDYTFYYSLRAWGRFTMEHCQRSSAMSTLIKPNLNINWPENHDPYTDVFLYNQLKYKLFHPEETICIGIKHGIGKCGGECHVNHLRRFTTGNSLPDPNKEWLKNTVDEDSFKFYLSIIN